MHSVVAFMDDLMFISRIREAARASDVEVRTARTAPALLEACRAEAPALVFVDLDSLRLGALAGVSGLRADPDLAAIPVVGFFSHLHAERSREAQAAGCTRVLARSAFVEALPGLLSEALHV